MPPITSIGDIGANTLSTVQTLTWDTAADWDNAVDQKSVVHEAYGDLPGAATIELGVPSAYADGANVAPLRHYPLHESTQGYTDLAGNSDIPSSNVTGMTHDVDGVGSGTGLDSDGNDDEAEDNTNIGISGDSTYTMVVVGKLNSNELSNTTYCHFVSGAAGNNDDSFTISADNSSTPVWFWNGYANDVDTGVAADANVNVHIVSYEGGQSGKVYWYLNGSQLSGSPYTGISAQNFTDAPVNIGKRADGHEWINADLIQHFMVYDRLLTSTEVAYLSGVISDGYLETATKSFSSSTQPDLSDLSYSLNGETINLDVIGSPGTASEEVVTQTLDGATSYTLTWSSGHTDFRIKPNLSTATPLTSPTFSAATLTT